MEGDGIQIQHSYRVLECITCKAVSVAHKMSEPSGWNHPVVYYPPPMTRRQLRLGDLHADQLLEEIYGAARHGHYRLAAMGIRSLLEQIMAARIGESGTLRHKLNALYENKHISLVQRDNLDHMLEAGNATIHRNFHPSKDDMDTLLDLTESVLNSLYIDKMGADFLAYRVETTAPRRMR
jgi:hypothetical protein